MKTNYFRVASNQWFTFSIITRKPPGLRNGRAKGCAVVPPNAIIYNFGVRASNLEFRTRFEFLEETSNVISRAQKLAGMWSAEREIRDLRRVRILRRDVEGRVANLCYTDERIFKASRSLITNSNFCLSIWESRVTVVKRSLGNFLLRVESNRVQLHSC